jgi:hypothetical protein
LNSIRKNYILREDWRSVRLPPLIDTLRTVQRPACGFRTGH